MPAQQIQQNECSSCGATNPISSKFCASCGSQLTSTATQPNAEPTSSHPKVSPVNKARPASESFLHIFWKLILFIFKVLGLLLKLGYKVIRPRVLLLLTTASVLLLLANSALLERSVRDSINRYGWALLALIITLDMLIKVLLPPNTTLWQNLVFASPKENAARCPICNTNHSSIDVVCTKDDTLLVGSNLNELIPKLIANALRIIAVAAALAVGYLSWLWPAYAFGGIVIIGFFALFLRRHIITLCYFLFVEIATLVGYISWQMLNLKDYSLMQISGAILVALFLPGPLFLVAYTLRLGRGQNPQAALEATFKSEVGRITLLWTTFLLTVSVFCFSVVAAARWLPVPELGQLIPTSLALGFTALGAAEVGLLVASTVYTLRGVPFYVPDFWKYRDIFKEIKLRQMSWVADQSQTSWHIRLKNTFDRFALVSINGIIQALEDSYNNFVVRFFNNLARSVVLLANAMRRAIIKAVRHLIRTFLRLGHLNLKSIWWAWRVWRRYTGVFIGPPLLCWLSAILLYEISYDFLSYVHGGPIILPLNMFGLGLMVFILSAVACGLLLHVKLFTFGEKVLNASAKFGPSAYLFFLLIALSLGIIGMLTNGPYRIGWVTIVSTVLLAAVFLGSQRRTTVPETAAREWLEALQSRDSNKLTERTCMAHRANMQNETHEFLAWIGADSSDLRIEVISQNSNTAQVRVTCEIRTISSALVQIQHIDQVWQMKWEDGRWKWCGEVDKAGDKV